MAACDWIWHYDCDCIFSSSVLLFEEVSQTHFVAYGENKSCNEGKIGKTTYTLSDNKAPSYIGDDIIGYKNEKGEVAFISVKENDNIFNSIDSITNKKVEIDDKTYTFAKDIEIFVNNKKSTASRLNPGDLVKVVLDKDEDVTAIYAYTFQKENVIVSEISEKYIKAKSYASNSSQYSIKDKRI